MNKHFKKLVLSAIIVTVLLICACYAILNDIYITSPTDGSYTNKVAVDISVYTSGEIANLKVTFNGEDLGTGSATDYAVTAVKNSANTVGAYGYDEIGDLVDSDEVTFYHDDISPVLSISHTAVGRTLTFLGTINENFVISAFTYEHQTYAAVEGSITPQGDGDWELALDDVPYARDQQKMDFVVTDGAGNTDEETYQFLFTDTTPPTLTVTPSPNHTTSLLSITFSGTATDDYELGALWYGVDNGDLQVINRAANGSWSKTIGFSSIGVYEVRFIAIDTFFNFVQQIVGINIVSP